MATTGTPQKNEADKPRSPEEQEIIDMMERTEGRKLTEQEIHLSLEQARALGELP
jgi:hypothetical protein